MRACEIAGVVPSTEFWTGEGSPTEWVVSQNLHRRHLDASQRAMVAAGLVPLYEAEARARQSAAGGAEPGPLPANLREAHGTAAAKAAAGQTAALKKGEAAPVRANLPAREDAGRARDKAAAAEAVTANLREQGHGNGGGESGTQ